jgi:Cytosine/adenosine deaminases
MEDAMVYKSDHFYMNKALALASKAMAIDEVPVGALVVDSNGIIIGRGYNQVERKKNTMCSC